eukprot:TRINITY_DN2858_c0_g1_i1.p2 TRINITY_DN2858_c0_g1~~TRINITY_DN2858_c0_g1_i1.p2  ORF type:complete len:201 (+),score=57.88 TRINITY_DN2858_c0_g1_i1:29-604(+)
MLTARNKLVKQGEPEALEGQVAQALFDLEVTNQEIKAELRELKIVGAREVDVAGGKKAIIIFAPYRLLSTFHKIQLRLVRELEKKFGRHVLIVGQRRILAKETRNNRQPRQKRPRSRTLTAVHDAILEDIVYPTEIIARRTRYHLDGKKTFKVFLDRRDKETVEGKLDTFSTAYKKLTGKDVAFSFPAHSE